MKQALQLKLSQHLTLTPQLQQSIRLLQLSTIELNQEIEQILAENPLLERDDDPQTYGQGDAADSPAEVFGTGEKVQTESLADAFGAPEGAESGPDFTDRDFSSAGTRTRNDDDDEGPSRQVAAAESTLREHLLAQIAVMRVSNLDRGLIGALIEALNDDGYLEQTLEEILEMLPEELELELDDLEVALRLLQACDPPGVGARDLSEALCLQLQAQRFGKVARAHPRRVAGLQQAQRHFQVVEFQLQFLGQHLENLFEGLFQVSVVVERLDQRADQAAVQVAHAHHRDLRQQVFAQGRFGGGHLARRAFIVVVVAGARAGAGKVAVGEIRAALGAFRRPESVGQRFGLHLLAGAEHLGRAVGGVALAVGLRVVVALEQRILGEDLFDLLVQLDGRELQQADRLLQLRRQRQVLGEFELQRLLHGLQSEMLAQVDAAHALIGNDGLGRAAFEHAPFADDVGAVADTQGFADTVVGDQHTDAAVLEKADDFLDVQHGDRIDPREGLVEQDEFGVGGQRARDLDAAPFAARQRQRRIGRQPRNAQLVEQLDQALLDLRFGQALQFQHRAYVLGHGELAEHRGFLRQVREPQAGAAVDRMRGHVLAADGDAPGVGAHQAHHHVEAGGLAGAVGTEQSDDLAVGHLERDVFHDLARLVALFQPGGRETAHFFGASGYSMRGAAMPPEGFRLSGGRTSLPGLGAAAAASFLGWITARTRPSGLLAFLPPITV